jgi:hypothetical protein
MKGSIRFALMAAALGLSAAVPLTFPATASADTASSNRAQRSAFGQVLPEVKFENVALKDALEFIRDVSSANIHVNWRAIEIAGVSQDTNVNMHLRNVSLRKTLDLLLSEAGGGTALTYYVDQGVIEVTTKELADKEMLTQVYPVQDLVVEIPDFTDAPNVGLLASSSSGSGQTTGSGSTGSSSSTGLGGGGSSIFNQNSSSGSDKTKTREERGQDLVALIRDTVYPNIWRENGGSASIRYWNGYLVVTAPRSVQEAIGGYSD